MPSSTPDIELLRLGIVKRALFRRPFRGKIRFAKVAWRFSRLRRRGFRGFVVLPTATMFLDARHWLDWAMLFGGMEQANVDWMCREFHQLSAAWDVGGHHGEFSLPMASLVRPGGEVQVFEAFPPSAEAIHRSVEANGLSMVVTVHSLAVTSRPGPVELHISDAGSQNHSLVGWVGESSTRLAIDGTTLDEMTRVHGVPDFVKIDIEGAEYAAFQGATELLAHRNTTFLFESELWDENRSNVHSLLQGAGYALSTLDRGVERPGADGRMIIARPIASSHG